MANYEILKNAIQNNYEWDNGENKIEGPDVEQCLLALINSLGANYQYAGIARLTPTPTDPGTPDQNVFYVCAEAGTYTNFGGKIVNDGEVAILKYNGTWDKEVTGAATAARLKEIIEEITELESLIFSIQFNLDGNGGQGPYFLKRACRFDTSGYILSDSYACSQKLMPGDYTFPVLSSGYQYNIMTYISDTEGQQLSAFANSERQISTTGYLVLNFRKSDLSTLTDADYAYLNTVRFTKTKSDLSLNEIRDAVSSYGDTESPNTLISQTIGEGASNSIDWSSLNISYPLPSPNFTVRLDKVAGHHNKYSIRLYRTQYNPRNIVIYDDCIMGAEYTVLNANIADYPYLYIREAGQSSWTPIANAAYKLTVKQIPQNTVIGKFNRTLNFIGKNVLMLGDSLTQLPRTGTRDYGNGIVEFFATKTGANVIRGGVGGSHISSRIDVSSLTTITDATEAAAVFDIVNLVRAITTNNYTLQQAALPYMDAFVATVLSNIQSIDFSKLDILTIFAGTNDFNSSSVVVGNEDSFDEVNNLRGALNSIIRMICTTFPHIKVYVFTPTVRWWAAEAADWEDTSLWCENYQKAGRYLRDFADAIVATGIHNQIPVCNLYQQMGWNVYNYHNYCNQNDGTHPYKGFEFIAAKMASFILGNQIEY